MLGPVLVGGKKRSESKKRLTPETRRLFPCVPHPLSPGCQRRPALGVELSHTGTACGHGSRPTAGRAPITSTTAQTPSPNSTPAAISKPSTPSGPTASSPATPSPPTPASSTPSTSAATSPSGSTQAGSALSADLYDAFGARTGTAAPSDPWGFGAQWGYQSDNETGLVLVYEPLLRPAAGAVPDKGPAGV